MAEDYLAQIKAKSQITAANFQGNNLGNGRTVELSWSVPDPTAVKYFVVEMWDASKKAWVPYDGFHGLVSETKNSRGSGPPQKISFDSPFYDTTVSFRLKSIGKNDIETDWTQCSVEVKVTGQEYAETTTYFIKEGLEVKATDSFRFTVNAGVAYLGGFRRVVARQLYFNLPNKINTQYVIYINEDGLVNFIEGSMTPTDRPSIRLAKIVVDTSGSLNVTDQRFLWSPSDTTVIFDPTSQRLEYYINFTEYNELNLKGWKIYRAAGIEPLPEDFKPIVSFDKGKNNYTDSYQLIPGMRYWYKVVAVDWGNNESLFSPAVSIGEGQWDPNAPAIPTGLKAVAGGDENNIYIDLTWDQNTDKTVGYNVWCKLPGETNYIWLTSRTKTQNSYRHSGLALGAKYTYTLDAYNELHVQSMKCDPVECIAGDTISPKAPEWSFVNPITSDRVDFDSEDAWVRVRWEPVTKNNDDTDCLDLRSYYVYIVDPDGSKHPSGVVNIADNPRTEYTVNGLLAGGWLKFVITAVDRWGNESLPSTEKTVMAGGIPLKAPVLDSVTPIGPSQMKVVFEKVTQLLDNTEITPTGYAIYRGLSPNILAEIKRISAPNEQPDTYSYTDADVVTGTTYYYAVRAYISNNVSDYSNKLSSVAGDTTPPAPATWVSLTTKINQDTTIDNVLSWTTGAEEDLYGTYVYFYRSDTPGAFELVDFIPKNASNSYSITHFDLVNGVTYCYKLVTVDTSGNESTSLIQNITAGTVYPPKAPSNFQAVGIYDKSAGILLTWDEVTANDDPGSTPVTLLKGYKIYRSENGVEFKYLTTVDKTGGPYLFKDLERVNGRKYSYKITAFNALDLESAPATAVDIVAGDTTVPAIPNVSATVSFVATSPSLAIVKLTVTTSDTPEKYEIWTSPDNVLWTYSGELIYTTTATYNYTVPYGTATYYKVIAVSFSGVKGTAATGSIQAINNAVPSDVLASNISVTFEPTSGTDFTATITWTYSPASDFGKYDVIINQSNPHTIASITDKNTKTYQVQGCKAGVEISFAIVVQNVYGTRSTARWVIAIPTDSTIPKDVTSVTSTSKIGAVTCSWDQVTQNTDNTPYVDGSYYLVEVSNDPTFATITKSVQVNQMASEYTYDTTDTLSTWYFRVKAYDRYGHASANWAVSPGVKANSLDNIIGGTAPPVPTWPASFTYQTGVEWANDQAGSQILDDPGNIWLTFSWNVSEGAVSYIIYYSTDDATYYPKAQSKTTSVKIDGLLANTNYYFKLSAVGKLGDESALSTSQIMKTARVNRTIPAPTNFSVVQGKGLLAPRWDQITLSNVKLQDVTYILEFRSTTDAPGGTRTWSAWTECYRGRATSYIHTSLEYNKYYQYRVQGIDSSGNVSTYAPSDYLTREYIPGQIGTADIAANAIQSNQIYSGAITADHISTAAIESRHIKAESITAGKIAAGAVKAQNLDVSMGGYNYVKNSAFGMTDLNGALGIDWMLTNCQVELITGVPIKTQYGVKLERISPAIPNKMVSQVLPVEQLVGKTVTVSLYRKMENIFGPECLVELIRTDTANNTERVSYGEIVGTSDWDRISFTYTVPTDTTGLIISISLLNDTIGTIWVTGIQVEEGDVMTQWNPNPDETYGSSGAVQINTSGIRVVNGKINVTSTDGNVTITGAGILATKTKDANGNPISFAKLDSAGMTIKNGAFSISSGDTNPSRIDMDGTGITAIKGGITTFRLDASGDLSVYGGTFKFNSGTPSDPNRLEISNIGLKAYNSNADLTVSLDSNTGKFALYGGAFEIKSKGPASTNEGLVFDSNGLCAYKAGGIKTFNLDTNSGFLTLFGGAFTISTGSETQTGEKVEITAQGLKLYDKNGVIFNASTTEIEPGIRVMLSGGFKLKSTSSSNQIVIDETGLYGNFANGSNFSLSQGKGVIGQPDYVATGFTMNNGTINCGDVHINSSGMEINGGLGLSVYSDSIEPRIKMVTLDKYGLKVEGGAGIKVIGSGSIAFIDPNNPSSYLPAIDKNGIKANAITAGVLTINGSSGDSNPRIEVKDGTNIKATLDKNGMFIRDGALNVTGPDGSAFIQNGKVLAQGLQIGIGASNLIRNGRAAFGDTRGWTPGVCTVVSTIAETSNVKAGVSGNNAFRFQGSTGTEFKQTGDSEKVNFKYTFSCWVYPVSGAMDIRIDKIDGSPIVNPVHVDSTSYVYNKYQKITISIPSVTSTPVVYKFRAAASNTVFYITDIMCVEGDISSAFVNHPTEIASTDKSVLIDDSGIKVTNGKFSLKTAVNDSEITIDQSGIYHKKNNIATFSLTEAGLDLNFPGQSIVLTDTNNTGLKMTSKTDPNKYVQLNLEGLKVRGGLIDIRTGSESVAINSSGITATKSSYEYVKLDNQGLTIVGGAFNIKSSTSGDRLEIVKDRISVWQNNQEAIRIGNCSDPYNLGYGINIQAGRFHLGGGADGNVDISESAISIRGTTDGEPWEIVLDKDGLRKYVNGQRDNTAQQYVSNIYVSPAPVKSGDWAPITGIAGNPKILAVPSFFQTYNKNYSNKTQYYQLLLTEVSPTGFRPIVKYVVDSSTQTWIGISVGGWPSYDLRSEGWGENTWICYTGYTTASVFYLPLSWYAQGEGWGDGHPGKVEWWVSFSMDGVNWTSEQHGVCEGGYDYWNYFGYHPGSPASGAYTYTYVAPYQGRIYARVRMKGCHWWHGYVRVGWPVYLATVTIDPDPNFRPEINYLAVERS